MGKMRVVILLFGLTATLACEKPGQSTNTSEGVESIESGDATRQWQQFNIEGAEVWTQTVLRELPERASVVEFENITVLDDGGGPELCLGGTADSLPPQCSGPRAEGLILGNDWTQSSAGTTWGNRSVTLRWPIVDGAVQVVSDVAPPVDPSMGSPRPEHVLPPECENIQAWMSVEVLGRYADEHRDTTALVWTAEDSSKSVLQVSGDPVQVRADLANENGEVCIEIVNYSRSQLGAAQDRLHTLFQNKDLQLLSTGLGAMDRVEVGVAVADRITVQAIVAKVGDPGIVAITGSGIIKE